MGKNPSRQCISCRRQLSRDNFIRLMKTRNLTSSQATINVNPSKYEFGRSAYLCKTLECVKRAIKEKKTLKVLKVSEQSIEKIISELGVVQERKKVLVKL